MNEQELRKEIEKYEKISYDITPDEEFRVVWFEDKVRHLRTQLQGILSERQRCLEIIKEVLKDYKERATPEYHNVWFKRFTQELLSQINSPNKSEITSGHGEAKQVQTGLDNQQRVGCSVSSERTKSRRAHNSVEEVSVVSPMKSADNSPQTKPTDISSESEEGTLSAKDKTEDTYFTTHSIKEIKPLSGKHANQFARKMLDAEKRGSMHHE